jgi:hypothetical protein
MGMFLPLGATMLVRAGQLPAARAEKTLSTTAVPQLLWKDPGPCGPGAAFYVAGIIAIASRSKSCLVALAQWPAPRVHFPLPITR